MKLKVGDKVRVMTGKDKGKEGKITYTFKKENKVIVEGLNMVKKHMKPNNSNQTGGIIEREAKIDASNVMIIDKKTNKPTRIYSKVDEKSKKKVRVGKSHEKLD
jgi:large subunit ribosomal protein L24